MSSNGGSKYLSDKELREKLATAITGCFLRSHTDECLQFWGRALRCDHHLLDIRCFDTAGTINRCPTCKVDIHLDRYGQFEKGSVAHRCYFEAPEYDN